MVSIHWVGVQTWLHSSHEGKRWWHPRGGSIVVTLFEGNLPHFALLFGNTYSDGFYTLGRCTTDHQLGAHTVGRRPNAIKHKFFVDQMYFPCYLCHFVLKLQWVAIPWIHSLICKALKHQQNFVHFFATMLYWIIWSHKFYDMVCSEKISFVDVNSSSL